MNKLCKLALVYVFMTTLSGCIAEDYDTGVPTAELVIEDFWHYPLHEANISWHTASKNVEQTVAELDVYAASLTEINIPSGLRASLEFKENKENSGDFQTSEPLTVSFWKDGEQPEVLLVDDSDFQLPTEKGNYVLEVQFINSAGRVQYVGNLVIK